MNGIFSFPLMIRNSAEKHRSYRKACGTEAPCKTIENIVSRLKDHPELPQDITLHGLRVSCVSLLIHLGMDIKSIQKWVGHKDINTTLKIYARVKAKEAKEQVAATMSESLPYTPKKP